MTEAGYLKQAGATPQKNSGRGDYQKADGIIDGLITVDVKEYGKSYTITEDKWAKLCMDNYRNGTPFPAMNIVIDNKTVLWLVGDEFLKEMWDAWKKVHLST